MSMPLDDITHRTLVIDEARMVFLRTEGENQACICCTGAHVFARMPDWPGRKKAGPGYGGVQGDPPGPAYTYVDALERALATLEEGARFRLVIEEY